MLLRHAGLTASAGLSCLYLVNRAKKDQLTITYTHAYLYACRYTTDAAVSVTIAM